MARTIEIKMGVLRHILVKSQDGEIKNSCLRCSLNGVCQTIGMTQSSTLCFALIKQTFDYPKDEFPYGGYFQIKKHK